MNLSYNRANLLQGNKLRKESEENPTTFAEYGGANDPITPDNLDKKYSRKAGPGGQFAQSLMTDPQAMQNLSAWQGRFMQSNQGAAFNQARAQQGIGRALGGAA